MMRRVSQLLPVLAGCAGVLTMLMATGTSVASDKPAGYWSDAWRGWHFYEEPQEEPAALKPPAVPAAPPAPFPRTPVKPPPRQKPPEVVELEQLRQAVEELRLIAVMRPTEANVRRYMELESKVVARASLFADVAQRVAWSNPELDPTLQGRPVNAVALEVFEKQQLGNRSASIAHLGKDHVLLFVFRSDCPYCHAMAPILDAFRARHGIQVVGISVDGGVLPGFADARRDNGIATTLRVTQVPAVFLAQPFTGRITPIGFGVLSEAQLLERISMLGTGTGDDVPLIPLTASSNSTTSIAAPERLTGPEAASSRLRSTALPPPMP